MKERIGIEDKHRAKLERMDEEVRRRAECSWKRKGRREEKGRKEGGKEGVEGLRERRIPRKRKRRRRRKWRRNLMVQK